MLLPFSGDWLKFKVIWVFRGSYRQERGLFGIKWKRGGGGVLKGEGEGVHYSA